jgi:hypothetical protein
MKSGSGHFAESATRSGAGCARSRRTLRRLADPAEQQRRGECAGELRGDEARNPDGSMPVKVSVRPRATVIAGLAKLVLDVNQYAAVM